MRDRRAGARRLDDRGLHTVDVGAGTGFSSEGIARHVDPANLTLLDQSPQQLSRARRKPALQGAAVVQGDAEGLPVPDRPLRPLGVCGAIEYWPDPQAAIAEAYRVVKPGGVALLVGPLPPERPLARRLADLWMLFPPEAGLPRLDAPRRLHATSSRPTSRPDWTRAALRDRDRRPQAGGRRVAGRRRGPARVRRRSDDRRAAGRAGWPARRPAPCSSRSARSPACARGGGRR